MSRLARYHLLALLLILVVAAYLRVRGLEHSPILADQSILLSIALRWVNQGQTMLPLAANKSSAGIMNPPLIAYLLALPLFLRQSLTAVHLFQAILSITAVLILYLYAWRLFGQRVALLAALLFAVNPWAVYYGRFLWNPNPIPLFSTLLLLSLLAYFCGGQQWVHLALSGLWLAAVTQLHLGSLVLAPTVALILLLFWRRWWRGWRWQTFVPWAVGLGLALLLYTPYLLFERAVGFNDVRATLNALSGGPGSDADGQPADSQPAETNLASWLLTQELSSGSHIFAATGLPRDAVWPLYGLFDMAQGLLALALLTAVILPITQRRHHTSLPSFATALVILALWILLPVALYLRHTVYLQNYYFLFLYPAPFLLLALLADQLMQQLPHTRWLIAAPLLLLALWQAQIGHARLVWLDEGRIEVERPLADINHAIAASQQVAAQFPGCDFIIVDEGGTPESSKLGLVEHFVYPTPTRLVDMGRGYIIPQTCALYLAAGADDLVTGWLEANATLLPPQVQTGDETWRFYLVESSAATAPPARAIWQNGLRLTDVQIGGTAVAGGNVHAAARLTLTYTWQVTAAQPGGVHYHVFNHLLNEQGEIVAQHDAPTIAATYWQPGDQLVMQFDLQMPPQLADGRYTLYLGLYTWPDLQRIPLQDGGDTFLVTSINTP